MSNADEGTIQYRDPTVQRGFTQTENIVLTDTTLSVGARFTYTLLKMFAWQDGNAFPGQDRLAALQRVKPRMIRYYLTELLEKGLITKEQRGLTQTNRYWIEPLADVYCLSDRQYIAGQERQPIAGQKRQRVASQDRQPIADNKDTVTNTQITNTQSETGALSGIAGTFDDSPIHRTLTSMSDTATGDISRNSSIPCADTVIATVKVDPFDSLPSARPSIVNGRPVHRGGKQTPPAMRDPSFEPTVQAIKAGYPLRDGAGPTEKEIRRALALVEPIHYGAIVAALPVYAKCKDVREGVVRNITTWLEDERWEAYQPKAAPVVSRAPSAVDEIARRRAARAQQGS